MLSCRGRNVLASITGAKRLRAGIPASWRIGDKTGTGENGATNDIAIVWPPNGAPILVVVYLADSAASSEDRDSASPKLAVWWSTSFANKDAKLRDAAQEFFLPCQPLSFNAQSHFSNPRQPNGSLVPSCVKSMKDSLSAFAYAQRAFGRVRRALRPNSAFGSVGLSCRLSGFRFVDAGDGERLCGDRPGFHSDRWNARFHSACFGMQRESP